jgi:hypothetical protein
LRWEKGQEMEMGMGWLVWVRVMQVEGKVTLALVMETAPQQQQQQQQAHLSGPSLRV